MNFELYQIYEFHSGLISATFDGIYGYWSPGGMCWYDPSCGIWKRYIPSQDQWTLVEAYGSMKEDELKAIVKINNRMLYDRDSNMV